MRRLVFVVAAACSGPQVGPGDGGSDGGSDSGGDANSCSVDQDGDGICDALDVCPSVPDPGQVDLDGDKIGWACDAHESTAIAAASGGITRSAAYHGQTFAGLLTWCASSSDCTNAIVAASPFGVSFARSDSTTPQHAWLQPYGPLHPPLVTRGERVLISDAHEGDVGRLDLATDTYTALTTKAVYARTDPRRPLELFAVRGTTQSPSYELLRPQGNSLATVATITGAFADSATPDVLPATAAPAVVAVPHKAGTTTFTYALSTFDPATNVLSPVAGVTALDELTQFRRSTPTDVRVIDEISYCARKGANVSYVGVRGNGITQAPLPFADCQLIGADDSGSSRSGLFIQGRNAAQNLALALVRGGSVSQIFTNEVEPVQLEFFGSSLYVVTTTIPNTTSSKAWIVTSGGTVVPLALTIRNIAVSVEGTTAHIVGIEDSGNNISGPLVLIRYREATGMQQVTVTPSALLVTRPEIVTSAEGAAIVSDTNRAWAVPSTSMTPVPLNLDHAVGGARGSRTVLVSPKDVVTSQAAVYAYDEPNGAPRLTQLTTEANGTGVRLLHAPYDSSEWFSWSPDYGSSCSLSRIVTVNNAPALESISCLHHNSIRGAGRWSNGDTIAWDFNAIYVLSPSGAAQVARSTTSSGVFQMLYDYSTHPETIVGWTGKDAFGGFACLASHPERCWTLPADAGEYVPVAVDATGDGSFAIMATTQANAAATLHIVRSIGTGDRPQPL